MLSITDTGEPTGPDVRIVADEAKQLGWSLQVQPARAGGPSNLHLSVSAGIAGRVDELLDVLRAAALAATGKGRADPDPQLAAAAGMIDVAALDDAAIAGLVQLAGFGGDGGSAALPDEMAGINALMEASPPELVEVLLKAVFAQVFR